MSEQNTTWYYATFSEGEAFAYAKRFFDSLAGDFPRFHESRRSIGDAETTIFRPAVELEVAGLCLLAGKPRTEILLPVSFAFFIVDHLAVGWSAMMASQFRVAYSLCRSTVEASIFEVAAAFDRSRFIDVWNQPAGTGGKVLDSLSTKIPDELCAVLRRAWESTRALGHASFMPVMSSAQTVEDHTGKHIGVVSFGGPYIEPLNECALSELAIVYGTAALAGLAAMASSLISHARPCPQWEAQHEQLWSETKSIARNALKNLGESDRC